MGHGPVLLAVSGRDHAPAVGKGVFAQAAVQDELVAGGLDQGRGGVEFVEEQHARPLTGQKGRRPPVGAAVVADGRQAAQVHGIEEHGPDVGQVAAEGLGGLGHHLAFAHAGRPPEEHGPAEGAEGGMGCGDAGRDHEVSFWVCGVPGTGYGFGGRFVGGMPGEFGEIMGSVRREPGHRRCVFQEPDDPGCASRNLSCGGRRVTATRLGRGGVVVPARRRAPTRRHHGHGPCPAKKPGGIGTDGRLQGLRIGRSAELPRAGRYLDIENENSCQECGAVRGVPLLRRPDSPWADGGAVTECGRKISFSGTNRANNKSLTFSRVGSLSITS